jgi:butyryl-CoA dehydrogenase
MKCLPAIAGRRGEGPLAEEQKLVASAKKLGLFAAGAATQKYMQAIQDQQEIMGAIADMVIEIYAMESASCAPEDYRRSGRSCCHDTNRHDPRILVAQWKRLANARKIIVAVAEGDMLRTQSQSCVAREA